MEREILYSYNIVSTRFTIWTFYVMAMKNFYKEWDILWRVTLIKRLWYGRQHRHLWLFKCHCWKTFEHIIWKMNSCWCWKTYNRKEPGVSLYNAAVWKMEAHMKHRWIDVSISKDKMIALIKLPCVYCWSIGSNTSSNTSTLTKTILHNGIDRIDSSKGYEEWNCVPCCKRCNRAKSSMSIEEFKQHIKKIYFFMFWKWNSW